MAKRRKTELDRGLVHCAYCNKPVQETAWRCPNCGKWFREGMIGIVGIIAILVLVAAIVIYIIQPSFVFGESSEETEKKYGVFIGTSTGPRTFKAEAGGHTEFGLHTISLSNSADNIEFTYSTSSELQVSFEKSVLGLTPGQQYVNIVRVDVPITMTLGSYNFTVTATSRSDPTTDHSITLTLEVAQFSTRYVNSEDKVQTHYILWVGESGVFRESSYERGTPLFISIDPANEDQTYMGVITGYSQGVIGMRTGETKIVSIPPSGNPYTEEGIAGKTLLYQIELVSIDTA